MVWSLFPALVLETLARGDKVAPEPKAMVTMLFCYIVGFTELSVEMPANLVGNLLDRLFDRLDAAAAVCGGNQGGYDW